MGFFCKQKPIFRCKGIFISYHHHQIPCVGCIADDVVRFFLGGFEDGLSGHLLKCSLISDLNDLFQVFIRNSLIYTIISTTSTVICVNILHDNVKVNTQNSTPNTNMAAPSKWRAAAEGHFETLMRNI